jgi:ribonuclease D
LDHLTVDNSDSLLRLCEQLRKCRRIALDTEFVSEDTYQPELCLVQVATDESLAVIDTVALRDLKPLWSLLVDGTTESVLHAGREEVLFCLSAVDRPPRPIFDVQLAAAFVGCEYPVGYGPLVSKYLGIRPDKGETRTDWRRRPLTRDQIHYALEDVRHLLPLCDRLQVELRRLGRAEWYRAEAELWISQIEEGRKREQWHRVSGISGLSGQSLAIVRELWRWRDQQARQRNLPPRRVLRDDLIAEIARRRTADPKRIHAVRGLSHGPLRRAIPDLIQCVERALGAPHEHLPRRPRGPVPPQLNLICQLLAAGLAAACQKESIAASLVATSDDLRELVLHRLGLGGWYESTDKVPTKPPTLTTGWRAEWIGSLLDDLLAGRRGLRIDDPMSENPLALESF